MSHHGFYQRRRGILDHVEAGVIDLIDLGLHDYLCLIANYRTGICSCSSVKIAVNCNVNERTIRRRLNKLEDLGYIKSWKTPGKRGNYPVLINKFRVRDMSGKEHSVNVNLTTDWKRPRLDPIGVDGRDVSEDCPSSVRRASTIQETRRRKKSSPVSTAATELADALRAGILRNNPGAKITSLQAEDWGRQADLMMRRDKRSKKEILSVIEWCQEDSFWLAVILSMGKLRKKYDQLVVKMRTENDELVPNGRQHEGGRRQETLTEAELVRLAEKAKGS